MHELKSCLLKFPRIPFELSTTRERLSAAYCDPKMKEGRGIEVKELRKEGKREVGAVSPSVAHTCQIYFLSFPFF